MHGKKFFPQILPKTVPHNRHRASDRSQRMTKYLLEVGILKLDSR